MPLPGDELLPTADVQRTFGRNLRVAPEALWPWVIQMGQERGGFYSYAALENLVGCRIVNADQVHPQWQQVRAGDDFHLHPDLGLRVALVDPPHALVVRSERAPGAADPDFDFSWAFVVVAAATGSRLLVRERYVCPSRAVRAGVRAMGPVTAVMTHGTLRGLDRRTFGT